MSFRGRAAAPDVLAVLALAVCAVVLHREGLFGDPTFYEHDTLVFYYPLAAWVAEQLRASAYPLWTPAIFTGYPIFADGELGLAYLPQVALLTWLPTPLAVVVMRALHAFLAGAFTYAFMRASARVGPLAALGGGLVFAFGSFVTAQMHHENVVRSAVWLPLVLLLADRALRRDLRTRRRWGWLALAALAFSQAALGVHVQPVLMIALALGGLMLFRLVFPYPGGTRVKATSAPAVSQTDPGASDIPASSQFTRGAPARVWRQSATGRWHVFVVLGTLGGGLLLAAVQWVPLLEWARTSFRAGGVSYEFASAFGLAPENLPTVLFPYFFRLPDGATWWTLWQPWETSLYVGVPTLALSIVGLFTAPRREAFFFLPLGVFALLVGMTHYAPIFNLHENLWSLPGFSFLRAPGRFTYLVVFAFAGMAALGLQALVERRSGINRLSVVTTGALPTVVVLAALLATLPSWHGWFAADPDRGRAWVDATYLAQRAQYAIDRDVVYQGMLASLDLGSPKTGWSVALLALTVVLFVVWLGLGTRLRTVSQGLFVGLLAVDLLVFSSDFHPRGSLAGADASLQGVPAGSRILVHGTTDLPGLEPNHPLVAGLRLANGYNSLPSQRHVDLSGQSDATPSFLSLWGADFVVEPTRPRDQHQAGGVTFRSEHPLAAGYAETGTSDFHVPDGTGAIRSVRIVGTLGFAFEVPQGEPVAELRVTDVSGGTQTYPLRAGIELAERAIDRPSIQPFLRHQKPATPAALDVPESSPTGEDYLAHLYLADILLGAPAALTSVQIIPVHPTALVQVQGIGLVQTEGAVRSLTLADRVPYRLHAEGAGYAVLAPVGGSARAALWTRAAAVDRGSRPDETPVQIMSGTGFDPTRQVLIEGAPAFSPSDQALPDAPWPVPIEDMGPNAIRVRVDANESAYLVVADHYHRGWQARVDGRPTPVYIANAVFRAVPVEPGAQVVEMRFESTFLLAGLVVSLLALLACCAVVLWRFWPARLRLVRGRTYPPLA